MIRLEVSELLKLGAFPRSEDVVLDVIDSQDRLLRAIVPPVTDDEARHLVSLFGPDDYFGAVWTVMHLIESSPHWPLLDCLADDSNEWIASLKQRTKNSGLL